MTFRSMALALTVATCVAAGADGGCSQAAPIEPPCRDIPANGCPLLDDDSECADPCCAAAYACAGGEWALAHPCPGFHGCDAGTAAVTEEAGPFCDAAALAALDAPAGASGGPGCSELRLPDCPLSEALVCSLDPCRTCETFFVCTEGAWIRWGECSGDGGLTLQN